MTHEPHQAWLTLDASVIVPTYNRAPILAASLPRLLAQHADPARYEVIVVDDGSTDDTPSVLAACACPQLVMRRVMNGGPARARNVALAVARGRTVIFVDDDIFVGPDFVAAHLLAHTDSGPGIPASVTGPIITIDAIPSGPPKASAGAGYHRHPAPTSNASVPAEAARHVGGFDERFTLYGWEDEDFARRLCRMGIRRRFARSAAVFHLKTPWQRTSLQYRLALEDQRGAMGALLLEKHPTMSVAILTKSWGPIVLVDRVLNCALRLDARVDAIRRGPEGGDPGVAALWRWLLLQHAEISAGHVARRR